MSKFHFNTCTLTDLLPPETNLITFLGCFLAHHQAEKRCLAAFQACFIKPSITNGALIQACPLEGSKHFLEDVI